MKRQQGMIKTNHRPDVPVRLRPGSPLEKLMQLVAEEIIKHPITKNKDSGAAIKWREDKA